MYKKLNAAVKQIEGLKDQMQTLSDEELKELTEKFRARLQKGETLDQILSEAYAAVREAAVRTLGMEHFPVQLLGGIILHQGKIVEMKTGEGKTLVSTLPAYLNALEGKGVHIVTVNDYLAKRDAEMMGKVYAALGMTTGVVLSHMDNCSRKKAYACDITYVTNSEVGFDYLRDNMVYDTGERVLRGLHYAIIDEIDSILIDEARTPLIISGQGKNATKLYEACDILAREMVRGSGNGEFTKSDILEGKTMEEDGDYVVNEKDKYICLTENGARKAETYFHIENLADPVNLDKQHTLIMALRAHSLMQMDKDYVVKNGEVLIVDAFTGRILPGRRFSDGLHQALEAKEHVTVQPENRTHATITFQNFFNKYEKKCGMTGTAVTEKREFKNTYHLKTCELPTNKPVIRKDLDDVMYQTKAEKYRAIIEEIKSAHASGQPVLVGTPTIDVSEQLSKMLLKEGISHQVLNAKQDEKEAQIVAEAGRAGSVTIATNMAGRGTDIQLDEAAKEAGGLYVIGTERHESRRIDNQLRGRSGRQGDPGKSCFFLSLEDDLMRIFGSERMKQILTSAGIEEGEPIGHRILSKSISKAQKKVEGNHYSIRKALLDYDDVKSAQRELIYRERDRILEMKDSKAVILSMAESIIDQAFQEVGKKELEETLTPIIPFPSWQLRKHYNFIHLRKSLYTNMRILYDEIEEQFQDPQVLRQTERNLLLHTLDEHWMEHLDNLETLQEGIGMYSYAQSDPRIIYKEKAYALFNAMLDEIRKETIRFLFHIQVDGNYIIGVKKMKDNHVIISGTLITEFKLSHTSYGKKFYEAFLASERTSGYQDENRIVAAESMIRNLQKGDKIRLTGEYRSSDWTDQNGRMHKKLYIFAQELHPFEHDENTIILEGYICKTPEKRSTPNGFLIADLTLAVNRKNGRSDYIPCIVWGNSAKRAEQLKAGDRIKLKGRMQSRVYQKPYDPQKYVAYEISGEDFEIVE